MELFEKKNNLNFGINHLLYQQKYLGFNYRLTDIQAALGISQLQKLNLFLKKRRSIAKIYNQYLNNKNLTLPIEKEYAKSSYHLYVVMVNGKKKVRDNLINFLKRNKIYTNIHYKPIHKFRVYSNLKVKLPITDKIEKNILTLPLYPSISKDAIRYVIDNLNEVLTN